MRNIWIMLFAALFSGTAAGTDGAAANAVDYSALSDTALSMGDLRNGAIFLDRAREGAGEEEWRKYTLKLVGILLQRGESARARTLLEEFARRYPDADRQERTIYSAELLASEGKVVAAQDELNAMLTSGSLDKELLGKALNAMGAILMRAGRYVDAADAYDRLEQIAFSPRMQFAALTRRIYALQLAGRLTTSAALLKRAGERFDSPEQAAILSRLDLCQLVAKGELTEFKKKLDAFMAAYPGARSDFLLYHALRKAGDMLLAGPVKGDHGLNAAEFYRLALDYVDTGGERRDVLRSLSNALLQEKKNAEAAEALMQYISFFAEAPDKTEVLMQAGRLFAAAGENVKALACFDRVTADGALPAALRIDAAREAAAVAEAAGLSARAESNLRYMIDHAATADLRQEGFLLLGEHSFRQKEFGRAAEAFQNAAQENGKLRDSARFWLMQSLIKLNDLTAAGKLAGELEQSADLSIRAAAAYFNAVLLDRTGKAELAKAAYLKFAATWPDSEYAGSARFEAARIAEQLKQYSQAAELYGEYAKRFPAGELAANALYRAMQCAFLAGDDEAMRRFSDRLTADYAESPFTVAALFRQVDYLRGENRYPAALAVLERISSLAKNAPEILARSAYDQAQIQARLNNPKRALALIGDLLKEYPKSAAAADAALLGGNLRANAGEYAIAAELYTRALALRGDDRQFADICKERIADCEFSAYSLNHEHQRLTQAVKLYSELAKHADPAFSTPALFKLGRSLELSGEPRAAVTTYNELLYRAVHNRKAGQSIDPVWTGKAAYAAATLLLKKGTPDGAREALRILEIAKSLNLNTGEDFDQMILDIRRKYRL